MDTTKVIRVFEAFAGIGAQRKALDNIKANYEIIGLAEWYVPAIVAYEAIHEGFNLKKVDHSIELKDMVDYLESKTLSIDSKEPVKKGYWKKKHLDEVRIVYTAVKNSEAKGNIIDVRSLHERKLEDVDLLTYSFPCQDLSQQGKQKGMSKDSNSRSGLLWEIEKALDATPKKQLPKYLLMENVMALTHENNKEDLQNWLSKLESLGYKNDLQVLNSSDFGSPQARRRTYMISTLGKKKIELPKGDESKRKALKAILDRRPSSSDFMPTLDEYDTTEFKLTNSNINKSKLLGYTTFNSEAYVYDPNHTGPTLTASGANSRIKINHKGNIRKMNSREAFKYMGFTKKDFNKVNNLNYLNEEKKIFLAGNSISIEVLEKVMEKIK